MGLKLIGGWVPKMPHRVSIKEQIGCLKRNVFEAEHALILVKILEDIVGVGCEEVDRLYEQLFLICDSKALFKLLALIMIKKLLCDI